MTSVLNFGKPTSQRLSLGEGGEEASNLLTWTYKSEGNRLTKQLQASLTNFLSSAANPFSL